MLEQLQPILSKLTEYGGLIAYCRVANADWFGTRDALFTQVAQAFTAEEHIALAIPKREITQINPE